MDAGSNIATSMQTADNIYDHHQEKPQKNQCPMA